VDASAGERLASDVDGRFVSTDVSRLEDCRAAVAVAEQTYGRLDLVHLNAGLGSGTTVSDLDESRYRTLMAVNVDGVVYGLTAALPALRRAGGGAVVATSSLSGLTPFPGDALYAASKHAVVGLVRSVAEMLAADGITINAVCPGFTDTPLVGPAVAAFRAADFPLLTAEEVAAVVVGALRGEQTGEAWVVQPGRTPEPYRFRGVPGAAGGQAPPEDVRAGGLVSCGRGACTTSASRRTCCDWTTYRCPDRVPVRCGSGSRRWG
jgi:NAD(P)-dependent dehydrogenase (short-subunit alcohol dehydrogenase family)